jgi:hypothetical protein
MTVRDTGLASQPSYRPGMDRRRFLMTSLVAVTIAAPLGAEAQKQHGNARIGLLGDVLLSSTKNSGKGCASWATSKARTS